MTTSMPPTVISTNSFKCQCDETYRQACIGEKFYKIDKGKSYCILHYPDVEVKLKDIDDFNLALKKKINAKEFNFRGIYFPKGASFNHFIFSADTSFIGAVFITAASFIGAEFNG